MKQRGSNIVGVIGTNNTGKTVLIRDLIGLFNKKRSKFNSSNYPSNYHKIVVYDVQNRLQDLLMEGDLNILPNDKDWKKKILNLRDSLIVLDDFKVLIPNDKMEEDLLNILAFRMEYGLDLIFAAWHPKLIIPRLAMFIDKYYLFATNCDEKDFASRINGSRDMAISFKQLLDKEFSSYTDNEYKNLYPNFPFIYYDSGKNKAVKINFK